MYYKQPSDGLLLHPVLLSLSAFAVHDNTHSLTYFLQCLWLSNHSNICGVVISPPDSSDRRNISLLCLRQVLHALFLLDRSHTASLLTSQGTVSTFCRHHAAIIERQRGNTECVSQSRSGSARSTQHSWIPHHNHPWTCPESGLRHHAHRSLTLQTTIRTLEV